MADESPDLLRERLMGLGAKSIRKSYYPQLQKRLEELELFHALLDHASDFIFLVDTKSGVVLDANQAACNLLGISKVHLAWKSFLEYFELARDSRLPEKLEDVADGETHEVVHATPDGRRTYFELTLSSVSVGEHRYTIGVARDITARKAGEEALRASEQEARESKDYLNQIINSVGDPIFVKDEAHRLVMVNDAECQLTGRSRDEVLGRTDHDFFPKEQVAVFWKHDDEVLETGMEDVSEEEITDTSGARHTIVTKKTRYVDTDGRRFVVGVIRDITERKSAEQRLARSEENFRSIVESSPSAMYFFHLEADGRLILAGVNPAARDLTPIAGLEFKDRTLEGIFPRFKDTEYPELFRKVARGEVGAQWFQTSFMIDQRLGFFDVHVFRTGHDFVAVDVLDVTERVRLQEMMIQTEKMMSLGGLAAGMAHEINNPLGGIMQGAQVALNRILSDSPANEAAAREAGCDLAAMRRFLRKRGILSMIETMRESAVRAAGIVSSMLEFSRKSPITHAPADVNALLDKAVELCATDYDLKKKYDFRRIVVSKDYDVGLPEVVCSQTQVQQVVMNLLANAAQAMAEKPGEVPNPTITLRTRRDGDYVRIEVADNGPGMAEEVRRKAFEPFFTTKPPGEGTGLGLSVSYFIVVQNHGGTMRVESQPGAGSRFIIRLPAGRSGEAVRAGEEPVAAPPA